MRPLFLHFPVALLAAGLGYAIGWPPAPAPLARAPKTLARPAGPLETAAASTWRSALPAVRSAPASRSEQAWVKWAFAVPDDALPAAVAGLNPLTDHHALRLLFSRWVRMDPKAAWKAFDELPIPSESLRWYDSAGHRDGLGMQNSRLQSDPRGLIAARMLQSWRGVDAAASLAYAKELLAAHSTRKEGDSGMLAYELAQFVKQAGVATGDSAPASPAPPPPPPPEDWRAAMDEAASARKSGPGTSASWDLMSRWSQADPDAAARWILALPAEKRSAGSAGGYLQLFGKAPPAIKMELFEGLAGTAEFPQDALDRFNAVTPGSEGHHPGYYNQLRQLRFGADALKDWINTSPAEAKAWLAAQPEGPLTPFLHGQAAAALSARSPKDAVAFLAELPDAELPVAVAGLTAGWAATDAAACAEWAAQIEDPVVRDASQAGIARQVMDADPAFALRLSLGISDDKTRGLLQDRIIKGLSWNPAALRSIIASDPALQAALGTPEAGKQ